ncbi:MAG: hypothetical protein NTY48_01815, partial [Candidatus Diapherotrites archaeon]|nr:hypothetical protein [Candidatus Diapherotrites archaeon]
GQKSAEPAWYTNGECGLEDFTDAPFCQSESAYQKYTTYTCNNAGTAQASCSNVSVNRLKETCAFECLNGTCLADTNLIDTNNLIDMNNDSINNVDSNFITGNNPKFEIIFDTNKLTISTGTEITIYGKLFNLGSPASDKNIFIDTNSGFFTKRIMITDVNGGFGITFTVASAGTFDINAVFFDENLIYFDNVLLFINQISNSTPNGTYSGNREGSITYSPVIN